MQFKNRFSKLTYLFIVIFLIIMVSTVSAQVKRVSSIGMTVSDMDQSLDFYSKVLKFEKVSEVEVYGSPYEDLQGVFGVRMRVVKMKLGDEYIELTEYLTPKGEPIPIGSRSHDLWFQHIAIVVSDMDEAYQHLRKHDIQHVSTAPQTIPEWNEAAAGIKAFYFQDADGHNLELIYFPKGKGDPKWQKNDDRLFLGIDHTAIAVSNTQNSLDFYRDLLGMSIMGKSLNYGTEQEHLNNVFGAKVRITSLAAQNGGPGIEFLKYLSPADGRPYPLDAQPNDILHWHVTVIVENLEVFIGRINPPDYRFISPRIIELPGQKLGFKKALLLRGPDGHAVRLVEK